MIKPWVFEFFPSPREPGAIAEKVAVRSRLLGKDQAQACPLFAAHAFASQGARSSSRPISAKPNATVKSTTSLLLYVYRLEVQLRRSAWRQIDFLKTVARPPQFAAALGRGVEGVLCRHHEILAGSERR